MLDFTLALFLVQVHHIFEALLGLACAPSLTACHESEARNSCMSAGLIGIRQGGVKPCVDSYFFNRLCASHSHATCASACLRFLFSGLNIALCAQSMPKDLAALMHYSMLSVILVIGTAGHIPGYKSSHLDKGVTILCLADQSVRMPSYGLCIFLSTQVLKQEI